MSRHLLNIFPPLQADYDAEMDGRQWSWHLRALDLEGEYIDGWDKFWGCRKPPADSVSTLVACTSNPARVQVGHA